MNASIAEYSSVGYPLKAHVGSVLDAYSHLTGPQLETLTHSESPWKDARNGLPCDVASNAQIMPENMKTYYRAKLGNVRQ